MSRRLPLSEERGLPEVGQVAGRREPASEEAAALSGLLERPLRRPDGVTLAHWALVAAAAALHLWDLGGRALHHDESLHAVYSWYLFIGRGYQHDPLMHGPFQFHGLALLYFLFGVSDFTAR
ncbi:MAG: hypothetical protein HYY05_05465, partial [Chloroflexi bacterium]|nr:hypothetical protein [Chloroflexota bacterium]